MKINELFFRVIEGHTSPNPLFKSGAYLRLYEALFNVVGAQMQGKENYLERLLTFWFENYYLEDIEGFEWFSAIHKEFRQTDVFSGFTTSGWDDVFMENVDKDISVWLDVLFYNLVLNEPATKGNGIICEVFHDTFKAFKVLNVPVN